MNETYLAHHGVKGMKWGVRRYADDDGNLTKLGKKRYSGKHGAAKYIKDTNPIYQNKDRKRSIRNRAFEVADAALYGYTGNLITPVGSPKSTNLRNITIGALVGYGLGKAASAAQRLVDQAGDVSDIENDPAMVSQMDAARRYLKSQGIDA